MYFKPNFNNIVSLNNFFRRVFDIFSFKFAIGICNALARLEWALTKFLEDLLA